MDLTLSGDFARHLLSMTKKDKKLAEAMARQFLHSIDSSSLAAYLLSADVAAALLADRIMSNPEKTLQDLQRLPDAQSPADGWRSRKGAAPAAKSSRIADGRAAKKAGRRRRHRLSSDELTKIKQQISSFLAKHPWSTRKEIAATVHFPTVAAYNRIMNELKNDKVILSQGEKSKTVYALQGASKRAGTAKKAAGSNAAKKAKKTKKSKKAKRSATAPSTKQEGKKKMAKRVKSARSAKASKRSPTKKPASAPAASEPTA